MADREIKHIRKNLFGDIIALCNQEEPWSPRQNHDAMRDIENGIHSYYVQWGTVRIDIKVETGFKGKYLKADHESSIKENLEKMKLN